MRAVIVEPQFETRSVRCSAGKSRRRCCFALDYIDGFEREKKWAGCGVSGMCSDPTPIYWLAKAEAVSNASVLKRNTVSAEASAR